MRREVSLAQAAQRTNRGNHVFFYRENHVLEDWRQGRLERDVRMMQRKSKKKVGSANGGRWEQGVDPLPQIRLDKKTVRQMRRTVAV
jgi:hypothetical protein